ncbi:MAG TPA: hypothetical protein VEB20_22430 [Azospirillaceae bacterium]|nr:hypothetical protein [Azospirillaceae bacterium]
MSAAVEFQLPSTVLTVLQLLRERDANMSVVAAVAFAFICENEGLSQTELCQLLDEPSYVVSRVVDYLGQGTAQVGREARQRGLDLVERVPWDRDRRVRVLKLTPSGQRLRQALNAAVVRPQPL